MHPRCGMNDYANVIKGGKDAGVFQIMPALLNFPGVSY
jgi:hypothetical protein